MADTVIPKTLVYCDLSRGYFVADRYSTEITPFPFGQFFSRNNLNLEIYPLVVKPGIAFASSDPFSQVDVSGLSLVLRIMDSTGATVLATQSTFTADATKGTLTGALNCDTVEMAAAVTSDPTAVIIEARFTDSSGVSKNIRASGPTSIRKQYNVTGSPTPIPGQTYLTEEESRALFVPRTGAEKDSFSMMAGGQRFLVYIDPNDLTLKASPVS